jgi:thiol-disulfide isomerase/thioredoxin
VKLWDVESQEVETREGHWGDVKSITFSPDGSLLASGSRDGTILLWDMADIGPMIPPFEGTDLVTGEKISSADSRGQVRLINFWGTWSAPCQMQVPDFVELYEEYKDQGFAVIGMALDDIAPGTGDETAAKDVIQDLNINYPVIMAKPKDLIAFEDALNQRIQEIPTTVIGNKEGGIASVHVGFTSKHVFEEEIRKLLGLSKEPPVLSDVPDQTIEEGGEFADISLDDYVSDPDNKDAEMVWTYTGNVELSATISGDRIATITVPDPEWSGSETITFTATDPDGLSDSDSAIFTVTPVNDPPVVSDIPDQVIDAGGTFTIISLDDYVSDLDNTDAEIVWTYSGNAKLSVSISDDHVATITVPDPEWSGSETITFTATDPGGLSDSDGATFAVEAVIVLGDVNNDGRIRSNDAILALRIAAGLMEATEYQKQAADMNGDGRIRSNDAILILRKAAGLT